MKSASNFVNTFRILLVLAIPIGVAAQSAPPAGSSKIGLVAFQAGVFGTNEGQKTVRDIQKKHEAEKIEIDGLQQEVEALKKHLTSASNAEERVQQTKAIEAKLKQLKIDADKAQAGYNSDMGEAFGRLSQKFSISMRKFAEDNGFSLVLDVSAPHSPVLWGLTEQDITLSVINAYNLAPSSSSTSSELSDGNSKFAGSEKALQKQQQMNSQQLSSPDLSQQFIADQQLASSLQSQLQNAQTALCFGTGTTAAVCNGLKAANIARLQIAVNQANEQMSQDQQALNIQQNTEVNPPQTPAANAGYNPQATTGSNLNRADNVPGLPQCAKTQYVSASLYVVNSCGTPITVEFTSDSGNTWGQTDVGPGATTDITAFGIGYKPNRDGKVYLFTCPKGAQPVTLNGAAFFPHNYNGQYTCHRQ